MPRRSESEVSAIAAAALDYCAAGWSVVPFRPRDKRPLIEWERFQHELASSATVTDWYRRWPDANVGVVTGTISNLVIRWPDWQSDLVLDYARSERVPLRQTVHAASASLTHWVCGVMTIKTERPPAAACTPLARRLPLLVEALFGVR
jgi:hypothetical protein